MKVSFIINYHTDWGQTVHVCGNATSLGKGCDEHAPAMLPDGDGSRWVLDVDVEDTEMPLTYCYIIKRDDKVVRREWGAGHNIEVAPHTHCLRILDAWCEMPGDKPLYASAFTKCVFRRSNCSPEIHPHAGKVMIEVEAPQIAPHQVVAVSGSTPSMGSWNVAKAVRMSDADYPLWRCCIDERDITEASEFKFVVLDKADGTLVAWEKGDNRRMDVDPATGEATVIAGLRLRNPFGHWRGAGVAIPVFSIRSEEDFGVGDFYDIMKMVDWAEATGQCFLQILPVNDTTMTHTWQDSYPYNANSTFALHPMYLRLEALGRLRDASRREYFDALRKQLNSLAQIDYEAVNKAKIEYFKEIFEQNGEKDLAGEEFKAFFNANSNWLVPYAAFCVLRDRFCSPDFSQWPKEYAEYNADIVAAFAKENSREMNYVYYLQYHLDKQMKHVAAYARSKGVAIKGDIPIGISRTSVDAWQSPELFNMDSQAGAPPDDFSALGQNWGFPTYNWDVMARDGYAWWKARFRKMSEYFDAYRIDHVLGFFRIWQIPMDAIHGLLGIFNPALPFTPEEMWRDYGFHFNAGQYTKPYIKDWVLSDIFAELADEVCARFLRSDGFGGYRLLTEFNTQRKVAGYFELQEKSEKNSRLCEGLLALIDNVLFIEDPVQKGHYHPRISAQQSYVYRSLGDFDKDCFIRLYNDFFYHRHDGFWYEKAMQKLPPLISSTDMLVCAEDLGMIPHCVPDLMHRLELLSLEIQRMPKSPNMEFGNIWHYPYYSVCTTSTHDMGGIRQWWEEDHDASQRFYNEVLHEAGPAPYFCEPWVSARIVELHLKSPSMLCILPLQDWLSMDGNLRRSNPHEERINVPANSRHYWCYRMHLTVEKLLEAKSFNMILRNTVAQSGR